ncbi:MAG: PH domain-containing protein [Candidatus Bathyarchaeota archaeon]|nr:PH domain-containing protein [Candidatus Bathyarchaeota archaeon]
MSQQHGVDLLHGEEVDVVAKPHTLSFLRYHLFSAYLIGVAWFLGWLHSYLKADESLLEVFSFLDVIFGRFGLETADVVLLVLFWLIILLSGFGIGVLWVTKMPLVYMVLVGVAGTVLEVYFLVSSELVLIPRPMVKLWLLGAAAVISVIFTEVYRRGHSYVITNYRIITKKGFIRKETRELMYDKITDVYVNQGILGRIFNFGTVIPISASGFGLGADSAQTFAGAAVPVKKTMVGGGFAGGKSVQRPRAATYFSLYGIPDPRTIRVIIGNRQLETKEAPILRRIEDLLKENKK